MAHFVIALAGPRSAALFCCLHVPLLCCLRVTIAIVTAIAGSRSSCNCCCCCGVPVTLGGKNVLAILLIEDVSSLLMMLKDCCRSTFRCCVVICVSRLPLLLPLSDCVPAVIVATAVVFLLHLELIMCWQCS